MSIYKSSGESLFDRSSGDATMNFESRCLSETAPETTSTDAEEKAVPNSIPSDENKQEDRHTQLLEEAIQWLPEGQATAYWNAKRKCPELVHAKIPTYLHYHKHNVWEAAKQVCSYWTERFRLFGEDRACLPLSMQTNSDPSSPVSALSASCQELIRLGAIAVLPGHSDGRKVILLDRMRWVGVKTDLLEEKIQAFFAIATSFAFPYGEYELMRSGGKAKRTIFTSNEFIILVQIPKAAGLVGHFSRHNVARFIEVLATIPTALKELHPVCCTEKSGVSLSCWTENILPMAIERFTRCFTACNGADFKVQIEIAKTPKEACRQLVAHGFLENALPASMGGSWNLEKEFTDWLCTQGLTFEMQHNDKVLKDKDRKITSSIPPSEATKQKSLGSSNLDELSTFQDSSEVQAPSKERTQTTPVTTGGKRSKTTRQAPETEEERNNRRRELNVIYSRRKRQKQKNRLNTLYQEFNDLRFKKKALEAEEKRLGDLLAQAEEMAEVYENEKGTKMTTIVRSDLRPFSRDNEIPDSGSDHVSALRWDALASHNLNVNETVHPATIAVHPSPFSPPQQSLSRAHAALPLTLHANQSAPKYLASSTQSRTIELSELSGLRQDLSRQLQPPTSFGD